MVEGESVFNEAIEFLSSISNLKPLVWDDNLGLSAMEHVLDIGPKGLLSYQSSDGTEPEERISKYGNYIDSLGENIDFGPNDAIGVLVSLTLDDGEQERPHRENLFKADYQKLGIACGPHKTEYQMCVMDFAFDFVGFDEQENDNNNIVNSMNLSNVISNITGSNTPQNNNQNIMNNNKNINSTIQHLQNVNKNDNKANVNKDNNLNDFKRGTLPSSSTHNPGKNTVGNNNIDVFTDSVKNANFQSKLNSNDSFKIKNDEHYGNINNNQQKYQQINPNTYNHHTNSNQSPLVRLSLDTDEIKNQKIQFIKNNLNAQAPFYEDEENLIEKVRNLNIRKKVVSKFVEVTTRIVYTYEDGTTKEVIEKQNHNFDNSEN